MRPIVRFYPCPQIRREERWLVRSLSSTVERFVYIEDVGGSNPSKSTKLRQSPVRRGVALHRKCRGFEPLSVHAQYLLSFSA